jgi:hypothetical protein
MVVKERNQQCGLTPAHEMTLDTRFHCNRCKRLHPLSKHPQAGRCPWCHNLASSTCLLELELWWACTTLRSESRMFERWWDWLGSHRCKLAVIHQGSHLALELGQEATGPEAMGLELAW